MNNHSICSKQEEIAFMMSAKCINVNLMMCMGLDDMEVEQVFLRILGAIWEI